MDPRGRQARDDLVAQAKASLGSSLREHRISTDRLLTDVASDLGISPGYLSDIEHGNKLPSLEMLLALASSLETTVSDLLRDAPPWDVPRDA